MISAIVTSMEREHLTATPSGSIDPATLIGKRVRYLDKNGKVWPGVVVDAEDPFVVLKFDEFPTSLGQGQLVDILEDNEDINAL